MRKLATNSNRSHLFVLRKIHAKEMNFSRKNGGEEGMSDSVEGERRRQEAEKFVISFGMTGLGLWRRQ
jgi:hypothetical protein